jgi:hypothetical protein
VNQIITSENLKRLFSVEAKRVGGGVGCLAAQRGRAANWRRIQR